MRHVARVLRQTVSGLACIVPLSWAQPALAFKEAGHRAIEAAAYRKLLTRQSECVKQHAPCPVEDRVISVLIAHGVLKPPSRPIAVDPRGDQREFTVEGLIVDSHMPDHLFDRQLEADRQCFHFNARGAHTVRYQGYTDAELDRIPRGLVQDAYVECMGVADALLRQVLLDPAGSNSSSTGIYVLMHMIEDSFSEAHVARDANKRILYVKPWNLRTWLRYFFTDTKSRPMRSHFSDEHHMTSEMRDLGYLRGPRDSEFQERRLEPKYRTELQECLQRSQKMLGLDAKKVAQLTLKSVAVAGSDDPESPAVLSALRALEGDLVVPDPCLSKAALDATDAIADLLTMIARLLEHDDWRRRACVAKRCAGAECSDVQCLAEDGGRKVAKFVSLGSEWLDFRMDHLVHKDWELTRDLQVDKPAPPGSSAADVRNDHAYTADDLAPKNFRELAAGLTTELRGGTPLWVGIDGLVLRNTASHYKTSLLLDTMGWGVQMRLPLENEYGERPIGVALDLGIGLPIPISEFLSIAEIQIYVGARGRFSYSAQSVFESETRHVFEFGFGGASLDMVVGGRLWLGIDAPRTMYRYDVWEGRGHWEKSYLSFSGGVALDAF